MQGLKLERIQENNWKQGVIIENPLMEQIISETQFYDHIKDSDLLILYTQDCDLINSCLEKEPFVEFFCVKKVGSINHDFAFGKNPRKIHLKVNDDSIYEFDINKRVKIDRRDLVNIPLKAENPIIPRREMDIVLGWFSKKYSRPAFPDAFNKIINVHNLRPNIHEINNLTYDYGGIWSSSCSPPVQSSDQVVWDKRNGPPV